MSNHPEKPVSFLKHVNEHQEIPEMIWTSKHEEELVAFCTQQLADMEAGEADPDAAAKFEYTANKQELQIHGIFVRVLNKRTMTDGYVTDVADTDSYLRTLLTWLADPESVEPTLRHPTRGVHSAENLAMALQSLVDLIRAKEERAKMVSQHGATLPLFALIAPGLWPATVHQLVLETLQLCGAVPAVVEDIIKSPDCLTALCCMLRAGSHENQKRSLAVLGILVRSPKILSETLQRGVVLYLLAHCSSAEGLSQAACGILEQMAGSPLHGLSVTEAMEQFLPAAVVCSLLVPIPQARAC